MRVYIYQEILSIYVCANLPLKKTLKKNAFGGKVAPSLPWCIRRSRGAEWSSESTPSGRQKARVPVLRTQASPGLENGLLALWAVFSGAESEFEVRFDQLGHLGGQTVRPVSLFVKI